MDDTETDFGIGKDLECTLEKREAIVKKISELEIKIVDLKIEEDEAEKKSRLQMEETLVKLQKQILHTV